MKKLFSLFLVFARIGGLTFGGGYAMLPMLKAELCDNRDWVTNEELINYYAIGQCAPGIIAVNTATFVGYKIKGIWGAIFAVLGIIFPSLVIITVVAAFLNNLFELEIVKYAFNGIKVAVAALVAVAIINLFKSGVKDILGIILFIFSFAISFIFNTNPIYIIIIGIVVGMIFNKKAGKIV